jgi:pyridoxine/pyridoxamine 5'-phosphate oxidase
VTDASDRSGIFAGDDPFTIARTWLREAERTEPNDPNAIALATVDADGLPNARMVLLKEIEPGAFVFYTNYESRKAQELDGAKKAAFVMHWKSLRRQIRVRGNGRQGSRAQGRYILPFAKPAEPAGSLGVAPVATVEVAHRPDGRGCQDNGTERHQS